MAFSEEDKILTKKTHYITKHINTLSIHSYERSGITICALKMQFVLIVFTSSEYLQKI